MTKNLNRKVTIYINGKEIENTIKSIRSEIIKLEREQKNLPIGSEEYKKKVMEIANLKDILKDQDVTVKNIGESWKGTVERAAEYSNILMGIQTAFQMIDLGIGKIKDLAKDAAELDDVYADVRKTTGLTQEEVENLNEAFKKIDTRTSREQLNQLAYEAGKLGINSEDAVLQFVRASDKINIALGDVLGDGAMVTVGKLTNIYEGVSKTLEGKNLEEKMLAIGSAVNSLGQASTANEGYMVEFMKRLGGIASQAGLSADQVLGYASALDQNGQAVEMAATAFMKLIQQMVKKPEEFVSAAGVSMEEFKHMMDEDMNGSVMRVLEGMEKGGGFQQLIGMFSDMGLDGARAATVVSSLAKHLDQVREAQELANQEMMTGNSVINEFNTKNDTMQAKAEKAKKRFQDVRLELGNELYPILIHLQKSGTVLMKGVAGLAQLLKEYPSLIITLTTAVLAWNRARLMNVISSGKLTNAIKTLVGMNKYDAITTAFQEKNEKKLIATKEAARLKAMQNMLATEKESLARQLASRQTLAQELATKTKNRVYALEVQVTEQATRAEAAHAAATKASRTAIMSIPWGMILVAVSAITVGITKLVKKSNEVKTAAKEISQAGAEAESKVRVLQDRLESSRKGTDDYRKALEELKEMYPDIVKQFVNEKGALEDVKGALEAVSAASKQAAMDQMYNQKAGDIYTAEAEKIQKAMDLARKISQSKSLAFWKEGTTDVQKDEAWRRYTEWVQKAQSGTVGWDAAIKGAREDLGKMGYVITSNFGSGSNDMIYQMKMMQKAAEETDSKVKSLNETLKNVYGYTSNQTNTDPYGLAGKSVKELNELLIKTKKYKDDVLSDKQDAFSAQKAQEATRKIIALEEAIKKLKDSDSGVSGSYNANSSVEETKEQKKARLAQEAWQRFENTYDRLIAKMDAKTLTGAEKVVADVDNEIRKMYDDLQAVLSKHPEAQKMMDDLQKKSTKWKDEQLNAYIKKMTDELTKQQNKLKETDAEGNAYVNKINEAQQKLKETFTTYDEVIAQAETDMIALMAAQSGASEEEQGNLQKQINALKELIGQYKILKGQMTARVFDAINTQDVKANRLSGDESQWRPEVQSEVQGKKDRGLGMLFNESSFDSYGKALEGIWQKYEKQKKAINEAQEANSDMLRQLRSDAEADPQNKDLQERISLREKEVERLEDEEEALEGLRDAALEAAEEDAFGSAIDRWVAGIDKFGQQAMQLWSNINKILDNVAQSELNKAKKQKEENESLLEEQLENGIISQEEYDEQMSVLQKEYDDKDKEFQLEQWKRQKALNIGEATMQGALAVLQALASAPPPYNAILAGIAGALAAVQIAAIASEPEPYAKGGYVDKDTTFFRAGEAGKEWIASNKLLNDEATAPIIQALESYQRGDRNALLNIPMALPNIPAIVSASESIGRSRSMVAQSAAAMMEPTMASSVGNDSHELVNLMRELVTYEKDPRNRQATISRRTMDDFNNQENFLRSRARL